MSHHIAGSILNFKLVKICKNAHKEGQIFLVKLGSQWPKLLKQCAFLFQIHYFLLHCRSSLLQSCIFLYYGQTEM